jgi:tRNA(fMet)-specific endonuclease VapC
LIVLDTNTIVHYLKGDDNVRAHIHATPRNELAVPSVVIYELEVGVLKSGAARRRNMLERGLKDIQEIPFDSMAAREAARIRVDLEKHGEAIGPMDILIAGTALSRGAALVTNNTKEFSRVTGLRLIDWRGSEKERG